MIRFARAGHVIYLAVFILAGSYASLLLLTAMRGLHNAQNTAIFGCGVFFIVRAVFAARASLFRIRALGEAQPDPVPWLASEKVFAMGDVFTVGSLGLTARVFWTNEDRLYTPVAPFGIGLAIASPFYLAATFQRLRQEWANT